ncbi:MAG: hypothetical protein IAI50_18485 [Candidatus Eremiobacteraeota bacterium]|nr:hypothetical protein [Candidatus Eremiobacteraeota bacterium]
MSYHLIDRYLLGEPVSKPDVVAALLAERSTSPDAEPFYRAFEAVGTRAADEAFIALRLVLAGRPADDGAVRRLRGLAAIARAAATGDPGGIAAALQRDKPWLPERLQGQGGDAALGAAARVAYFTELGL